MNNRVPASSSSEAIRALRETGHEPIFTVDEHKTLNEIINEIDWSTFSDEPEDDAMFESTREPVYHLDGELADPLRVPTRSRRTFDEVLVSPEVQTI